MNADPTQEFLAAMAEYGLEPGTIKWNGRLHRFPCAGKKKGNDAGWYRAFTDGRGAVFGDFSQGIGGEEAITWQVSNGKKPDDLDPEEWAKMKREWAEAAEAREIAQAMEQDAAAEECQAHWDKAGKPNPQHGYLVAQGIVYQDEDWATMEEVATGARELHRKVRD